MHTPRLIFSACPHTRQIELKALETGEGIEVILNLLASPLVSVYIHNIHKSDQ
jgi:hypothetical protein